jgi:hypothetical protein
MAPANQRNTAVADTIPLLQRLYHSTGEWHLHRGVRVMTTIAADGAAQRALAKVFAALDVLATSAPRQIDRLPSLLHSLAVARLPGALGQWRRDLRVALLDRDFVLDPKTSPEYVASIIVHELTHARLERAGFQVTETTRLRHERICCLAERNFLARLPQTDERRRLESVNLRYLQAPPDFWSPEASALRVAAWRLRQPAWLRLAYDVAEFLRCGHRAALSNER